MRIPWIHKWGYPRVDPGRVCAQPRTDPTTSYFRWENPPLTAKTNRSGRIGVVWSAVGSVKVDDNAARDSILTAICIFHCIFARFVQKSLDLSKKTSNRHLIFAKLTRSKQKYTKLSPNLSKNHRSFARFEQNTSYFQRIWALFKQNPLDCSRIWA